MFKAKQRDYRLRMKKNIYLAELGGEYILLSISPFIYFSLNESMKIYIDAIQANTSYTNILTKLHTIFPDTDQAEIRRDLDEVVECLRESKLLKVSK